MAHNTPAVSVLIVVYNGAAHVHRAVKSILNQTFTDFELIVVDDGSTDATPEILNQYAQSDSRVRILTNAKNEGLVATRNKALSAATAKYAAILDSDDLSFPQRLAMQFDYMEQHRDCVLCGCKFEKVYADGRRSHWNFPQTDPEIRARMMWGIGHLNSSVIIRMETIRNHSIHYRSEYPVSEDYQLFYDLGKCGKMANLPDVLGQYFYHEAQQTSTKRALLQTCATQLMAEHFTDVGVAISQSDFQILHKAFNFIFSYSPAELKQLAQLFEAYAERNRTCRQIPPELIEPMLARRWFEACYFSTSTAKLAAWTHFAHSPQVLQQGISTYEIAKLRLKSMLPSL